MKNPKQVINDVIKKLSIKNKNQSNSSQYSNDTQLSPFDLIPIQFTGMIEDYLFRQSKQIFDILKEQTDHDIQGLTYDEIKNDIEKNMYYDKVRLNIPKYYAFKPSERQKHFKTEGQLYLKKLGLKQEQISNDFDLHSTDKKQAKPRESTPMKSIKLSKKQILQNKKQQKKISKKVQYDNTNKIFDDNMEYKEAKQQKYETPQKKKKQIKKVKFFQFQYVKDFSQYKTPKGLAIAEQLIEPLKQVELSYKKQE